MTIREALARFRDTEQVQHLVTQFLVQTETMHVRDASGSSLSFLLDVVSQDEKSGLITCIVPTEEEALYLLGDLAHIRGSRERLYHLPPTGIPPYDTEHVPNPRMLVERSDVIQALTEPQKRALLVVSAEALAEQVASQKAVAQESTLLHIGMSLRLEDLVTRLDGQGFTRVEFVEAPGEMAVRGGLLDVFPFIGTYPIRIEFFGDEIDTLREFDPTSQRSVSRLESARLLPRLDVQQRQSGQPLTDALPPETRLVLLDPERIYGTLEKVYDAATVAYTQRSEALADAPPPERLFVKPEHYRDALPFYPQLRIYRVGAPSKAISLSAQPQPSVGGRIEMLRSLLRDFHRAGLQSTILSDTAGQRDRLHALLSLQLEEGLCQIHSGTLHEGFVFALGGFALLTDHQVFNRYHRPTTHKSRVKTGGLSIRDLLNLKPGDFVVHIDHGIGKFGGMENIEVRGKKQEAVRLFFEGGDVLYVNVNALYKLARFSGEEGHQPTLTRLGSGQWEKTKAKTRKRVKDIARDLIQLYARRVASRGYAYSTDSLWQREMEASFEYEDTPDQAAAAEAVKADMEKEIPMDRLVCGDVGFGKTEVAVRAAFKAVQDGKQVAILVPTTILAQQHFQTFSRRLAPYPVRIEVLSRFKTTTQQKEIAKKVADGEVDIVVGTQRLASKDVQFKQLGLLVIDEEQRFGVAMKERLRQMRASVDTLTLTATPIPRTLQFSLMGARDLSVIQTPPPNRQPIVTEIHTFDKKLIRDAILYEVSRDGQVFFIHNRVEDIHDIAGMLQALLPGIRFRVAHGQMKATELEDVMTDFMAKAFDVLVATSIVESGLDVGNANTMIINRADRFGLSEIHQMRGRVGRSDRKAFCYLLVPSIHALTPDARKRLQAVEEFSELGSGFSIAMRDLDIRGAGNMLGAEQSGFVAELGFETYQRILEEAVQELRHDEFSDLFQSSPRPRAVETTLDIEEDALIPQSYVANNVERLNLYRRIAEASLTELPELLAEIEDRFGAPPDPVRNLFLGAELRLHAQSIRLGRVQYKNERLWLDTPGQEEDAHFFETWFQPFLSALERSKRRYVLKDLSGKKLRVIVQAIPKLQDAHTAMLKLVQDVQESVLAQGA